MKLNIVILTLILTLAAINAQSQTTDNPPQFSAQSPSEEIRQRDQRPEESESLTSEQQNRVKTILSKYNESSLTAADAKAINNAFREAGIRNGSGLQQVIKDAGFVPEKIRALDPAPNQPAKGKESQDRPAQGKGGGYSTEQAITMPQIPNPDFLLAGPTASKPASSLSTGIPVANAMTSFSLRSSEVQDGGTLPVEFTGDGASATLPLEWTGAPVGTKSYTLIMHHIAPDMTKWYWILYNIPAKDTSLPKNVKGIGTWGNNSVNDRTEYAPPHSKGLGAKTYILTIYALSAPPQLTVPPSQVNREVLLAAMKDKILGTAELSVVYTRTGDETTR